MENLIEKIKEFKKLREEMSAYLHLAMDDPKNKETYKKSYIAKGNESLKLGEIVFFGYEFQNLECVYDMFYVCDAINRVRKFFPNFDLNNYPKEYEAIKEYNYQFL